MKIRFLCSSTLILIILLANVVAQEKIIDGNFPTDLEANLWNLEYQIGLQNIQQPQFADVIRKNPVGTKLNPQIETNEDTRLRIISNGDEIIKSGKATTTFKYNSAITLKDYLLIRTDSTELRNVVEQYANTCLKLFRKRLRQEKLAQNDIVDAGALAFVISYEVFFGQMPTKNHTKWMVAKGREILLKSPSFQGVSDSERQRTFEIYGVLSMYSKVLQERGLKGDLVAAKEAKETASEVLREIWGNSTDTILMLPNSFIHKGQKIIADGKATELFKFDTNLDAARKLALGNSQTETQYRTWLNKNQDELQKNNLPNNDLARCGSEAFTTVHNLLEPTQMLSKTQSNLVYDTFKKAILTSPDIQAASDENKQMACTVFVIRSTIISNANTTNNWKTNAKKFVADLCRAFGEDFNSFKLKLKTN